MGRAARPRKRARTVVSRTPTPCRPSRVWAAALPPHREPHRTRLETFFASAGPIPISSVAPRPNTIAVQQLTSSPPPLPPPRQTQSVKMSSGGSYHTPAADGSTPAAAAAGGAAAGAVRRHPTYPTAAPSASPRPEPVQSMTLLLVPTLLCRRHQQMAAVVRIQWQPLASSISGG